MIGSGIALIVMLGIRILLEWLAGQYEFLQSWLIWFTLIVAAVGLVFLVTVICRIRKEIKNSGKKEGGKNGN